eukprot:12509578-Ditylum_brightwellii.AAC.1
MDLYPLHSEALQKAKILPEHIPTVQGLYQQEDDRRRRQKKKEEEEQECRDNCTIYFVVGHSRFWQKFNLVKF